MYIFSYSTQSIYYCEIDMVLYILEFHMGYLSLLWEHSAILIQTETFYTDPQNSRRHYSLTQHGWLAYCQGTGLHTSCHKKIHVIMSETNFIVQKLKTASAVSLISNYNVRNVYSGTNLGLNFDIFDR